MLNVISKLSQVVNSRYNSEQNFEYNWKNNSNIDRLKNFADIFSQIGRGSASVLGTIALAPARITLGMGGTLVAFGMLGVNGIQCLVSKDKRKFETFKLMYKVMEFSRRNLFTGISIFSSATADALFRVMMISADVAGIILPEIGKIARNIENQFTDSINEDLKNDYPMIVDTDNRIVNFVFEHVWPRGDKYMWVVLEDRSFGSLLTEEQFLTEIGMIKHTD